MIAYTGIETVSNLAEEARDPVRSIPRSISMVAVAVFAIYFTLPLVALSALPVHEIHGTLTTALALTPEEGGFQNDPVLGVVEHLGISGGFLSGAEAVRRPARGDDPLHRDERRHHRRLPHHVLDGRLPPAPRRLPPPPSPIQDAVAVADRLRGLRLDPRAPAGEDGFPGDDVLVRRDALVHRRARLGDPAAAPVPRPGARFPRAPEPSLARRRLAAVRLLRRNRDCARLARRRRAEPGHALRRPRLARARVRRLRRLPAAGAARCPCARRCARRSSTGSRRPSSSAASSCRSRPATPPTRRWTSPAGSRPSGGRRSSRSPRSRSRSTCRSTRELPEDVREANEQLDEARAIGDSYGVSVIGRIARTRNIGRAIVDEAIRRALGDHRHGRPAARPAAARPAPDLRRRGRLRPPPRALPRHGRDAARARGVSGLYRRSVFVFGLIAIALGIALLAETVAHRRRLDRLRPRGALRRARSWAPVPPPPAVGSRRNGSQAAAAATGARRAGARLRRLRRGRVLPLLRARDRRAPRARADARGARRRRRALPRRDAVVRGGDDDDRRGRRRRDLRPRRLQRPRRASSPAGRSSSTT